MPSELDAFLLKRPNVRQGNRVVGVSRGPRTTVRALHDEKDYVRPHPIIITSILIFSYAAARARNERGKEQCEDDVGCTHCMC